MNSTEGFTKKWGLGEKGDSMAERNPHLAHLIGKSEDELNNMFPNAKPLDSHECGLDNLDHAIFMEHEQHDYDMKKRGMIKVMYKVGDTGNLKDDWDHAFHKFFEWYDGNEWVELTQ